MSEKLKHDYVYSMKPTPSHLAVSLMDEEAVRKEIKKALKVTRDNCVEPVSYTHLTLPTTERV